MSALDCRLKILQKNELEIATSQSKMAFIASLLAATAVASPLNVTLSSSHATAAADPHWFAVATPSGLTEVNANWLSLAMFTFHRHPHLTLQVVQKKRSAR